MPSFPGSSRISSSSRFAVEGVFRQSGVVHSLKVVDPVLFVFESHVLYSRNPYFFPYDFASYFSSPVYPVTNLTHRRSLCKVSVILALL